MEIREADSSMAMEAMADNAGEATRLLKALANHNRLMILCVLVERSHSVSELNHRVPLSQSALSQHLARLRRDELVRTRREAQTIFYSLSGHHAHAVIETLDRLYGGRQGEGGCDGAERRERAGRVLA